MAPKDDRTLGARVRAARSYAGLSQKDLADKLGLERRIVLAIESNDPRHELTVPEAQRVARECGVPLSFIVGGWAAPAELVDQVAALEDQLSQMQSERAADRRLLEELTVSIELIHATLASAGLGPSASQGG
jgi:transcriptional regulator with XRE-family HTH domain